METKVMGNTNDTTSMETDGKELAKEHNGLIERVFGKKPPKLTFYKKGDDVYATNGFLTVKLEKQDEWANLEGINKLRIAFGNGEVDIPVVPWSRK